MIGKVGSVLGDAGVNIAEYHQARLEAGGQALAAVAVDQPIDSDVIEQLVSISEVSAVWQIQLPDEPAGSPWTVDESALEPAR